MENAALHSQDWQRMIFPTQHTKASTFFSHKTAKTAIFSLCMFVCLCVCACGTHRCLPQWLATLLFEAGSLAEVGAYHLCYTHWRQSELSCRFTPSTDQGWILCPCQGSKPSSHACASSTLHTEPSSSSHCCYFINISLEHDKYILPYFELSSVFDNK